MMAKVHSIPVEEEEPQSTLKPITIPPDIIRHIALFLDVQHQRKTLASISQCSKALYRSVIPILWRHITINHKFLECHIPDTHYSFPDDHTQPGQAESESRLAFYVSLRPGHRLRGEKAGDFDLNHPNLSAFQMFNWQYIRRIAIAGRLAVQPLQKLSAAVRNYGAISKSSTTGTFGSFLVNLVGTSLDVNTLNLPYIAFPTAISHDSIASGLTESSLPCAVLGELLQTLVDAASGTLHICVTCSKRRDSTHESTSAALEWAMQKIMFPKLVGSVTVHGVTPEEGEKLAYRGYLRRYIYFPLRPDQTGMIPEHLQSAVIVDLHSIFKEAQIPQDERAARQSSDPISEIEIVLPFSTLLITMSIFMHGRASNQSSVDTLSGFELWRSAGSTSDEIESCRKVFRVADIDSIDDPVMQDMWRPCDACGLCPKELVHGKA